MQIVWGNELNEDFDGESLRDANHNQYLGFLLAVETLEALVAKGYTRPQELANIMREYLKTELFPREYTGVLAHRISVDTWHDIKARVIKRDGGECTWCGASDSLHVHHIETVKDGGLPEDDNLITLCAECHRSVHKT